jgi:hypothetical protein
MVIRIKPSQAVYLRMDTGLQVPGMAIEMDLM